MDITDHGLFTRELRRREAYLAEAQRLSHTGSFGWRVSSGEVFWSDETFRIFEFVPSSKVSMPMILERVHPQDMPSVEMAIGAASRGEGIDLEHRLVMPDGRIKYLQVVAKAESGETGDIEVIGAVMDVTTRKLTEIELRRSKVHLADAQRLSRTGSVGMEVSTKRIFWSEEAARIYGYPPGTEPTPDLILQRSHPDDVNLLKDVLKRMAQGGSDFDWEHRLLMPDGSIKHLHDLERCLRDEAGNEEVVGAIMDITERKVTEEAIRRSEAYLAEAQRISHTGSFGCKASSGEMFWSEETFRIFGYARDAKPAVEAILKRVHPDDKAMVQAQISHATSQGKDCNLEYRLLLPDDSVKYVHVVAHAVKDKAGNLEFVGAVTDITERKTTEEDLRSSEGYLAEAQKMSQTGSWAWSAATGGPSYWSEECYRVLGFDPTDGLPQGEDFFQRIHPDDRPGFRELAETSIREKAEFEADYRVVHPDGRVRDIHVIAHPVLGTSGELVEFVGTVIDVTERKRAEEELRRSEMELRQVLDLTPQLIAVFGPNRERLHINRIALDYLGLSVEEWRQTPHPGAFVHPDDQPRDLDYFDRAVSTGSSYELELRLRKFDGSYRWFLARSNPVLDDKGNVVRWYVASTDIEDRKQAEERLQQENVALREEINKASMFEEIVGTSPALQAVLSRISKVAPSDSTVLITGETGTGKELVARAIHRRSHRASRAFVSVNCAAIPRDLIASELFGHERGAFTGATQQRLGRFELANGGTLFLDEVGELPAETQIALLRVLQEYEFERVGGTRRIRADVRVIAATNRDLQGAIRAGSFRSDLFYRLHVFPIEIPSLRERRVDIPLLVEYLIDRYARKAGKNIKRVHKKTLELLQSYPWPGNIRELQNVIERSVILCETEIFTIEENWLPQPPPLTPESNQQVELPRRLLVQEKDMIQEALRASRGRVFGPTGAAAKLGIPRSTLESKIKSLKIDKNRFRTLSEI
jgi:PAS domain S-box-containing protein